jgi:hypothetical protein
MNNQDFTTSFEVDQTPDEVFAAINNVRGWWAEELEGDSDKLGDEFTYRHGDVHMSKQKITEIVPGQKIVWLIEDAYLSFTKDKGEWKGTEIVFEISKKGIKTDVLFTHRGLVPAFECFNDCSSGWNYYVNGSLQNLITTGKGQPDTIDQAD